MTWLLVIAVILIGVGMFAAGIASGPSVRNAWWRLDDKRRSLRQPAPEAEPAPDHPRFGPLLTTPPGGIEVTRGDGVLSVRADLPVKRRRAEGDPFTREIPVFTDEVYEELRAERPPTIEELREEYERWRNPALTALSAPDGVRNVLGALTEQAEREMRADYFDGVQPDAAPAYGQAPELEVAPELAERVIGLWRPAPSAASRPSAAIPST